MQNSLAIQLQILNSQNARVFFLLTSNKFFTKSKNESIYTDIGK